jgi:catechol 2,3-dioxygenase-like lactoylglutathione lyase family enzyme
LQAGERHAATAAYSLGGTWKGSTVTIKLNHTIVHSKDKRAAAEYFTELFGLPKPKPFGPFLGVEVGNEVTLDFMDAGHHEIQLQHYAFLVSEEEFDQIFGRIAERGQKYWADPGLARDGQINRNDGGRGVYFEDPSGHLLEIITRPYGSGAITRGE